MKPNRNPRTGHLDIIQTNLVRHLTGRPMPHWRSTEYTLLLTAITIALSDIEANRGNIPPADAELPLAAIWGLLCAVQRSAQAERDMAIAMGTGGRLC